MRTPPRNTRKKHLNDTGQDAEHDNPIINSALSQFTAEWLRATTATESCMKSKHLGTQRLMLATGYFFEGKPVIVLENIIENNQGALRGKNETERCRQCRGRHLKRTGRYSLATSTVATTATGLIGRTTNGFRENIEYLVGDLLRAYRGDAVNRPGGNGVPRVYGVYERGGDNGRDALRSAGHG